MGTGNSSLFHGTLGSQNPQKTDNKRNNKDRTAFLPKAMQHTSPGIFTDTFRLKYGGHGQRNRDLLDERGFQYKTTIEYKNGVRVGHIPSHKQRIKRTGDTQSWFPKHWTDSTIRRAGKYVVSLKQNHHTPDGVTMWGMYKNVRVGVKRTNGKIATIFPDAVQPSIIIKKGER